MVNKPKPGSDNVLVQCGAQECTPCSSCDGPKPFTALAGLPRLHPAQPMSPYASKDEFDFFAAADRTESSLLAEAAQMAAFAVVIACLLYIASSFGAVPVSGCAASAMPPTLWPVDQGVDGADYVAMPASPARAPRESVLALAVSVVVSAVLAYIAIADGTRAAPLPVQGLPP